MSSFSQRSQQIKWQVGLETDIGGGRENQDDCFVWIKKDVNLVVLCVLDGHGREVGRIASESAKRCLFKHLDENYQLLVKNPEQFLVEAHDIAHNHIRSSFRLELERQGMEVCVTEEGYLMKRRPPSEFWSCVHGGTSCSMAALVGSSLYIANVGDSSGILCASGPILSRDDLVHIQDAGLGETYESYVASTAVVAATTTASTTSNAADAASPPPGGQFIPSGSCGIIGNNGNSGISSNSRAQYRAGSNNDNADGQLSTLMITAEHSPESSYEYQRLRDYRSRLDSEHLPALLVVYDSSSHDKTRCAPVFDPRNNFNNNNNNSAATNLDNISTASMGGKMTDDDKHRILVATGKGSYYKNVRKEWASLVATPPYAKFQDALAFTRSLGDLHLHTYGVTHKPEVQRVDLDRIFSRLETVSSNSSNDSGGQNGSSTEAATSTDSNRNRNGSSSSTSSSNSNIAAVNDVSSSLLCLVLATDGVWDNWVYEDVNKFVLDESCIGAVACGADGARRVTLSFMQRNALYAKRNFGAHADNATGIVMYLSRAVAFPSQ